MDSGSDKGASRTPRKSGHTDLHVRNERTSNADRRKETAQYLSDMILELRTMAKSAQLYHVMVPLEYAYYEAFSVANRVDVPQEEAARIKELSALAEQIDSQVEDY